MRILPIVAVLCCTGCAANRPVSANWRLIKRDPGQLLIPPGVSADASARKTIAVDVARGRGACPPEIRPKQNRVLVAMTPAELLKRPPGWLTSWAAGAESQGCIAPGEAAGFAAGIVEALPLDPDVAFHVLYPGDLVPPVRLEVVSPILNADLSEPEKPDEAAGNSNSLAITARAPANLLGYETAVYAVLPKRSGGGFRILPLYAERHVGQAVERIPQPAQNYFMLPPEAAYYRLFVKSGQTDFTALVIAALGRPELERIAETLAAGPASCDRVQGGFCIAIPRRVALNAVIPVTVNGAEIRVRWGATVEEAIRNAGVREPRTVASKLIVSRPWKGQPRPIDFDHADAAILRLILAGGETISWSPQ